MKLSSTQVIRTSIAATALVAFSGLAQPVLATSANAHNPAGNNGTIKMDAMPFDNHPDNQPHVGCTFQVDFYNFDKGNLNAKYTFELQPPTGKTVLDSGTVFIGEDAANGGGDLDASKTVNLSDALIKSGATPQDKQGYHVKLTVEADGSQGAKTKHKVFWVKDCAKAATPTVAATVLPTQVTQVGKVLAATPAPTMAVTQLPSTGPGSTPVIAVLGMAVALVMKKLFA